MKLRGTSPRPGISELMGTMIVIAITLVAGAAVFGYVNSQAGMTERQYGSSAGQTVEFLSEKFVIPLLSFRSSPSAVTVWVYNSGEIEFQPAQILLYNSTQNCPGTCTSLLLQYNATAVSDANHPGCVAPVTNESPGFANIHLKPGGLMQITLAIPTDFVGSGCVNNYQLSNGGVYYVTVLGLYGNTVTYFQVMGH